MFQSQVMEMTKIFFLYRSGTEEEYCEKEILLSQLADIFDSAKAVSDENKAKKIGVREKVSSYVADYVQMILYNHK